MVVAGFQFCWFREYGSGDFGEGCVVPVVVLQVPVGVQLWLPGRVS